MRIALIDVDNYEMLDKCFPNLALMKISAWHKSKGDTVEWYDPLLGGYYDKCYMSKVFSFTPEYPYYVNALEIQKGGSGYCISLVDDKEVYDKSKDKELPYEIEHIMPDYSLYGIKDTAYGRLTIGCPRGCQFCHTGVKDGLRSHKVADLSEFWNGQKNIVLIDQNILAAPEYEDLLNQLIESKAYVEFNGGLDIRLMTEKKAELIKQMKIKLIHFAWDRYEDGNFVKPKLLDFANITNWDRHKVVVYVLCGFKQKKVLQEDLERIDFIRNCGRGFQPYVMLYDKDNIPKGHELRKLQRWVNNKFVFMKCNSFDDYLSYVK